MNFLMQRELGDEHAEVFACLHYLHEQDCQSLGFQETWALTETVASMTLIREKYDVEGEGPPSPTVCLDFVTIAIIDTSQHLAICKLYGYNSTKAISSWFRYGSDIPSP